MHADLSEGCTPEERAVFVALALEGRRPYPRPEARGPGWYVALRPAQPGWEEYLRSTNLVACETVAELREVLSGTFKGWWALREESASAYRLEVSHAR